MKKVVESAKEKIDYRKGPLKGKRRRNSSLETPPCREIPERKKRTGGRDRKKKKGE